MSNSTSYYDSALLSEVAYVYFHELGNDITNAEKVKDALQNSDLNGGLTLQQAEYFTQNYQIISHQENTETGFSATLFQNKNT